MKSVPFLLFSSRFQIGFFPKHFFACGIYTWLYFVSRVFYVLFKELPDHHFPCKKISVLKSQSCHEEVCRIAMSGSCSFSFLPCPSDTAAVKVTLFATSQFFFCVSVKASINVSGSSQPLSAMCLFFSFNNMRTKDKNFNDCDKNCEFSGSFIYFHRITSNSSFFCCG